MTMDDSVGDAGSLFDGSFAMNLSSSSTSTRATGPAGASAPSAAAKPQSMLQHIQARLQTPIISMEDDEIGDEHVVDSMISGDHGPYRQLQVLLEPENLVFSAVFLNFVLTNSNPSPLLFYMITGLYIEGNNIKDMRKWAYEIHSTFLVPRAPLLWCGARDSEQLARGVDAVLQTEHGKIEILRAVFRKGRNKAKEHIARQLDEFKLKRTAGLGTMFGPSDQQLCEAKGDKQREQRVIEETLMPRLQQLVDELERDVAGAGNSGGGGSGGGGGSSSGGGGGGAGSGGGGINSSMTSGGMLGNECPKKSALCSALSTVLHRIYVTGRTIPGSPIDRVHHYVSREKSFRSRLMNKTRKTTVRGHNLQLHQYHEVTHCNHCQDIIWGVSPQGYQCANCELNIHRVCSKTLEENCPGPAQTKTNKQNAHHHHHSHHSHGSHGSGSGGGGSGGGGGADGKHPSMLPIGQSKQKHMLGVGGGGGGGSGDGRGGSANSSATASTTQNKMTTFFEKIFPRKLTMRRRKKFGQ